VYVEMSLLSPLCPLFCVNEWKQVFCYGFKILLFKKSNTLEGSFGILFWLSIFIYLLWFRAIHFS
jgi:hypothetical protein